MYCTSVKRWRYKPIHFLLLGQTAPLNLFPVHTHFYVIWPIGVMGKSNESLYYPLVCFQQTDQSCRSSVVLAQHIDQDFAGPHH